MEEPDLVILFFIQKSTTLRQSNIAMENPPFEDVFPIQDGDFPLLCLFTGGVMVNSWFALVVWIPAFERDCYLGVSLQSQTTGPQTTN